MTFSALDSQLLNLIIEQVSAVDWTLATRLTYLNRPLKNVLSDLNYGDFSFVILADRKKDYKYDCDIFPSLQSWRQLRAIFVTNEMIENCQINSHKSPWLSEMYIAHLEPMNFNTYYKQYLNYRDEFKKLRRLDMISIPNGASLLMEAVRLENIAAFKKILELETEINHRDLENLDALSLAVMRKNYDMAEMLIEKDAEVDRVIDIVDAELEQMNRVSLLIHSIINQSFSISNLLIVAGAPVNFADSLGLTALIYASHSGQIDLVKRLISNGAYVNIGAENGKSALDFALIIMDLEIIHFLMNNGASLNAVQFGDSPLIKSCRIGSVEIVRRMVELGANVNYRTYNGQTAIYYALFSGNVEIIRLLLDNKADPNLKDHSGLTPLMYMSILGNFDLVSLLLEYNSNVHLTTSEGRTAYDFAKLGGHENIATIIYTEMKKNLA